MIACTLKELFTTEQLNQIASMLIGDGKLPNIFFVSYVLDGSTYVFNIYDEYEDALSSFKTLSQMPNVEDVILEDRSTGMIKSLSII